MTPTRSADGADDVAPRDHIAWVQERWRTERPDLDVRPLGVIARLHRLGRHLTDELVAVYREHGLSEGEFDLLATLRREGAPFEVAAGELAARTVITTGGLTKRLDRLEQAGLVARRVHDHDARGRVVGLTDAGRRVIDAAFADHMANEARLLAALAPDDADRLEALLAGWLRAVEPPGSLPPAATRRE
jgi:DNA-binding MarR family transcriptional regulator